MGSAAGFSTGARLLFIAAAFVLVVAGLREAQPIVVPFLLALFLAVITAQPLFLLTRKGMPFALALTLVIVLVAVLGGGLGAVVGASLNRFLEVLPTYEQRLAEKAVGVHDWLESLGVRVPEGGLRESLDPGIAMRLMGGVMSQVTGLMANSLLIGLTVVFLLVEATAFPSKIGAASSDPGATLARLRRCADDVHRYLGIKTAVSLVTGVLITLWLWILGVDFAVLWGLFAFLFNFIPNLGSILAAVPAVLLASIQLGGAAALWTGLGYVVVNVVIGSVVEPRFMGKGLGLSTLVVFLSLVFWGWVFGPIGMLLSVPLTMTAKIALESTDEGRRIAVMLGGPPKS